MSSYFIYHHHHQSVLPKGRTFTANSGTKAAVLPKGRSSTANSRTKVAVLLGMNRCGSFPLLSTPHSLFSIWTDLKWFEEIPGAPAWRWGDWIWLTGPSGLQRNSTQGLNIISTTLMIRDSEIPIILGLTPHTNVFYTLCQLSDLLVWLLKVSPLILQISNSGQNHRLPLSKIKYLVYYTRISSLIYRVIDILCAATDGCRSRPCLTCLPLHGASNCRCLLTLALIFSSVSE